MRRSEIFDSFVKIAQEKGLISEAEHAEHTETSFHETNPRHDSLSIEQISKLYGVKPVTSEDMKYKKNIMEIAHPNPMVISPAHDKLNGLIENNIERQNIILHIVNKEPDGHLTQRKYAEKQLMLSLVRIANDLDNQGHDKLCKLADICLEQTAKKKFRKVAFPALLAGMAAAVGLLYLQQHMDFHSDGLNADWQKFEGEINDLVQSGSSLQSTLGAGYSYTPAFLQMLAKFNADMKDLFTSAQAVIPLIQNVEKPRTDQELAKEIARIGQDPKTQEASQAVAAFQQQMKDKYPEIQTVLQDFSDQSYKDNVIANKGVFMKALDWTRGLHGGAGLISDDFDDVRHALAPLQKDFENLATALVNAGSVQKAFEQKVQGSEAAIEKLFTPQAPAAPEAKKDESPWDKLEEEGKGLAGHFFDK